MKRRQIPIGMIVPAGEKKVVTAYRLVQKRLRRLDTVSHLHRRDSCILLWVSASRKSFQDSAPLTELVMRHVLLMGSCV